MDAHETVALIPLRAPGSGKSRLAPELSAGERASLAAAMLTDVLTALGDAGLTRRVVVAGGSQAAAAATRLHVDVLRDPPGATSLDTTLASATRHVSRAGAVLVVAADLPGIRGGEVRGLLETEAHVVVAPTHDGGTGGLLRRPPLVIGTAYGRSSALRHLNLARQAGVTSSTLQLEGFAHDVDTVDDLRAALDLELGAATRSFLDTSGIAERLRQAG